MDHFSDRREAGRCLAKQCQAYAHQKDAIVLALPRGGVPVAHEFSKILGLPMDIFVIRKLCLPSLDGLLIGAIATGNIRVFNEDVLTQYVISQDEIDDVVEEEKKELERLQAAYRGQRPPLQIWNKKILLIDDGIATGATVRAAISALRWHRPLGIHLAVPVISDQAYQKIKPLVDKLTYLIKPAYVEQVGDWYQEFSQTRDQDVYDLLRDQHLINNHPD